MMTTSSLKLLCLVVLIALLAGCEEHVVGVSYGQFSDSERKAPDNSKDDAGWFGLGGTKKTNTQSPDAAGEFPWAIGLGRIEGLDHLARAEKAKAQLLAQSGFKDIWLADEPDGTMVYAGHYPSPQDKDAQADVERWRQMRESHRVNVPAAMLVPVITHNQGSMPEYDLRGARSRGLYTLQVGFYDDISGKSDYRKVAEQAVAALRKEGVEAYYYHGPNRSMVTVGVFGPEALNVQSNGETTYAAPILALQQRFPYNLANGETIREKRGDKVSTQPSFLVRIPDTGQ
ncbi:MAG: hypothetical protein GC162_10905 [Planctomycetes bacterium]|nr:hypothetical protein [Planctomycetota bacterium]